MADNIWIVPQQAWLQPYPPTDADLVEQIYTQGLLALGQKFITNRIDDGDEPDDVTHTTASEKFLKGLASVKESRDRLLALIDYHAAMKAMAPRSPKWPAVRAAFLKEHPACAGCGGTADLEAHHRLPFHVAPSEELDPRNLVALCNYPPHACHFHLGHSLSWKSWNPNVDQDAAAYLKRVQSRPDGS